MKPDHRIREAETRLFARSGLQPEGSFLDLGSAKVRLRVLSVGAGPSLVMLHGVSLAAGRVGALARRSRRVSGPPRRATGPRLVRAGHLPARRRARPQPGPDGRRLRRTRPRRCPGRGPFAGRDVRLWYAAARPGRIASLVAIGEPAVALPGATVRMPLSLMTVPGLGEAVLRAPMPRQVYRRLLGQGLSPAAAAAAPDELLDVLRLAARGKGNARTVASLMAAITASARPRADSIMTDGELRQITAPTMFCWGTDDPFLAPAQALSAIAKIPGAVLHEVPGGHGPWLEDPAGCAKLVTGHFAATGFAPASKPT